MQTITITCNRCRAETTGQPYEKSERLFYRCPACGRAMRLAKQPTKNGVIVFIPSRTGKPNRDMELIHVYVRRDVMAKLRKTPNYSEQINFALANYLNL